MAFNRRVINKDLDTANLNKHNDNYADIESTLDSHDIAVTDSVNHIANAAIHTSQAEHDKLAGIAASAGTVGSGTDMVIGNRVINDTTVPTGDSGTLTVLFGWLANMIKAITGKASWRTAPATTLEAAKTHMDSSVLHVTQAEHNKLTGIAAGAEVNQLAFSQVNNIPATSKTDTINIVAGTGIIITNNPATKTVKLEANGESLPGAHGSSHDIDGSDPIPDLVALQEAFDALDLDIPDASLTVKGKVQLTSATNSTSETLAATPKAVKDAYDRGSVALDSLGDEVDVVAAVPITLTPGIQTINVERLSAMRNVAFKGRTLVNLLGRDGGFEVLSRYGIYQASVALDTVNKVTGASGLKVTISATFTTGSGIAELIWVTAGRYYIYVGMVKNGTGSLAQIVLPGIGGIVSNPITDTTKFNVAFRKFTPATTIQTKLSCDVIGVAGNYAYFDELRLYEISLAEYTAIDSMTAAQVAAKWPYTEGISNVDNVYVNRSGDNQALPFPQWSLHATSSMVSPYKITQVSLGAVGNQYNSIVVPALENTDYVFSVENTGIENRIILQALSATNDVLVDNVVGREDWRSTGGTTVTGLLTPIGTTKIRVYLYNKPSTAETATFTNPMLSLGTVATVLPFEPNDNQSLYLWDMQTASNLDGSIADSVYQDKDGHFRVLRQFKSMELTGDLQWIYDAGYTGYKQVRSPIAGHLFNSQKAIKYDGKYLTNIADGLVLPIADCAELTNAYGIYLTIASADSGWGDSYTPTTAEIQAYFYGWKMYDGVDATHGYNGTGAKLWARRWSGGFTDGTGTLPTKQIETYAGWTPYKLQYQLATPVDEPIKQEGVITLLAGDNQIEVGSGVLVRERVNVFKTGYGGTINYISGVEASSIFKYRVNKIINVFKNGNVDRSWVSTQNVDAYGNYRAYTTDYDPSAVYTVTYLTLDTYLTGLAPLSISADYAPNLRGAVDSLVDTQADVLGRLGVVENLGLGYVRKAGDTMTGALVVPSITLAGTALPQIRNNAGILEFNNGTEWNVVGAGDEKYKNVHSILPTLTAYTGAVWVPLLSVTGKKGYVDTVIFNIGQQLKLGERVRVTLDGVAVYDWTSITNSSGSQFYIGGITSNYPFAEIQSGTGGIRSSGNLFGNGSALVNKGIYPYTGTSGGLPTVLTGRLYFSNSFLVEVYDTLTLSLTCEILYATN
ncbi:MAG: phage tail protein [Gorillibacterium sp.]|nr:phage tail protein [Gorillibacterium sp.]